MGKVKLSKILDLFNGFAFKSTDYVDHSEVLNCRMSNIRSDGRFDILYNPRYLPNDYANKFSNYKLQDGDLIVAMTDLAGDPKILGVPTIVQTKGKVILLNQRVGKLILKEKEKIFVPWLRYNLSRKKVQKYYSRFSNGGLQINLGKNDLLSYEIDIPPLSTQKAIAEKLDKADALRKKDQELLAQYDELAQAIFIDMFGDPVKNEKGWETSILSEIAPFKKFEGKVTEIEKKIWLLNLDMIQSQTGQVIEKKYVPTSDITNSTVSFNESQVLYSKLRPYLNKVVIPDSSGYATSELIPMNPTIDKLDRFFLGYLLRSKAFVNYIEEKVAGAKMPRVSMDTLRDFEVILPPILQQTQFAEKIQNIEAQKALVKQQAQQSEDLFQALLQESFNF